jgi:hypothetical protein
MRRRFGRVASRYHEAMPPRPTGLRSFIATLCALAAGCASGPRVGGDAWVRVDAVLTARDLSGHSGYSARRNLDVARLRAAGVDDAAVAAGRVALVSCSPSVDATWSSFALLPPGLSVQRGQVVRLRVLEDSGNERLGLNTVVGGVEPLPGSRPAYRAIPDWRERGLSNNFERITLPPEQAGRYRIVQGSCVIAC